MSRESSPFSRRGRFAASFFSRSSPAFATLAASSRGTTTTPSSSATITSPGFTCTPAHTTGTFTEPTLDFTVPLAEIARDHTGNCISVISRASRQPTPSTTAFVPRLAGGREQLAEVAVLVRAGARDHQHVARLDRLHR